MTPQSKRDARRIELNQEYYKLIDIIQGYDDQFLSIKTWSVTLSSVAIGLSFARASAPLFIIGAFLALSFWIAEARHKILQLNHTLRITQLEKALSSDTELQTPLILSTFQQEAIKNADAHRWRSVMFWPQLMFPHIFFFVIGIVSSIVQLFLP
jgi:hypothetical protein